MVLRSIATSIVFMVDELVVFVPINVMRPPVQGKGVVAVCYYLWLRAKFWQFKVFLKDAINVLEANQT